MSNLSWAAIKRLVYARANGCCEYCQTCEANTGQTLHIEHIDPNGGNVFENLCLSCANCNLHKAKATQFPDPLTKIVVPLYNPRPQMWHEHFAWDKSGVYIEGLSETGRATIDRLKMNDAKIIFARGRWASGGYHPPKQSTD